MSSRKCTLVAAGIAILAGCMTSGEAPVSSTLSLTGELVSRARIALPADGRAIVELRAENDPKARVVAEQRIELQGRQVPIAFELNVDRARLSTAERYAVRGGVESRGRFAWVTDPVTVDMSGARAAVGPLQLKPMQPLAFSTVFNCGGHRAVVGFSQSAMQLVIQNETFELNQVRTASGARYEAVNDATTSFWNKGDRATLTVRGRSYPECVEAKVTLPLRATGNEPSWRLDIADDAMTLLTDFGQSRIVTTAPVRSRHDDMTQFSGRTGAVELVVTVADRMCGDSMSGMPHPYTVTVRGSGRVLHGCGGDPRSLLNGREWVVEDLDGKGIIDRTRITLTFDDTGTVAGLAGCNSYSGTYLMSGEGLTVKHSTVTRKNCAVSLMNQEQRFLEALRTVDRFDITPDGALVLRGGAQRSILARN